MSKAKFNKNTLDEMLEKIMEEYFKVDNDLGLWEIVEYVKDLYRDEINTLEN